MAGGGPPQGSTPWYLLTSEPVENEAQAWKVVMAYARRWQIELAWKSCKSELGMQSPRVWQWETHLKLLGLATLAFAIVVFNRIWDDSCFLLF